MAEAESCADRGRVPRGGARCRRRQRDGRGVPDTLIEARAPKWDQILTRSRTPGHLEGRLPADHRPRGGGRDRRGRQGGRRAGARREAVLAAVRIEAEGVDSDRGAVARGGRPARRPAAAPRELAVRCSGCAGAVGPINTLSPFAWWRGPRRSMRWRGLGRMCIAAAASRSPHSVPTRSTAPRPVYQKKEEESRGRGGGVARQRNVCVCVCVCVCVWFLCVCVCVVLFLCGGGGGGGGGGVFFLAHVL